MSKYCATTEISTITEFVTLSEEHYVMYETTIDQARAAVNKSLRIGAGRRFGAVPMRNATPPMLESEEK